MRQNDQPDKSLSFGFYRACFLFAAADRDREPPGGFLIGCLE